MLCAHHNRLLLSSLASAVNCILRDGGLHTLAVQLQRYSTESSNSSSASSSSSTQGDDPLSDFQQRVAALQSSRAEPSLQALKNAAGSSSSSSGSAFNATAFSSGATAADTSAADHSSTSSGNEGSKDSLGFRKYGYAVLGGVNPEVSQQEAGAQQPKLHPTRDFRHGDMYEPTELSPLSQEQQEAWLPKQRKGRRPQRVPLPDMERLDFKNVDLLLKFVSDSGRLQPRRMTGLNPVNQARAARTVKLARQMAIFPYEMRVGDGGEGDRWRRMREVEAAQRSGKAALRQL